MGKAWKQAEKQVAKRLRGQRRVRINYSESVEDVIHPIFSIEVKYGKQIPKYCRISEPLIISNKRSDAYILFPSKDMDWMFEDDDKSWYLKTTDRTDCRFIAKGIKQARAYNKDKIPLLCMKYPNQWGFILAMHYGDWFYYKPTSSKVPRLL